MSLVLAAFGFRTWLHSFFGHPLTFRGQLFDLVGRLHRFFNPGKTRLFTIKYFNSRGGVWWKAIRLFKIITSLITSNYVLSLKIVSNDLVFTLCAPQTSNALPLPSCTPVTVCLCFESLIFTIILNSVIF